MISVIISSEYKKLVGIHMLIKEILGQVEEGRYTPGVKECLKNAHEEFIKLLKEEASKHNSEIIFHNKDWVFMAKSGEMLAMQAGYYITTENVLQLVIPQY